MTHEEAMSHLPAEWPQHAREIVARLPIEWRSGKLLTDLRDWVARIDYPGQYRHGGDLFSFVTVREGDRMFTRVENAAAAIAALVGAGIIRPGAKDERWHWVAMSRSVQARGTSTTPGLDCDAMARAFTLTDDPRALIFRDWYVGDVDDHWCRMEARKRDFVAWRQDWRWKVGY